MDFPNLYIPGFPKCGSTALAYYLGKHPEIYMPIKEPYYFEDSEIYFKYTRLPFGNSCIEYKKIPDLSKPSETYFKYWLDGTVGYFWFISPKKLKQKVGDSKIIFSIRDPEKRLISQYYAAVYYSTSFEEWIKCPSLYYYSTYYRILKDWVNVFGKNNVVVIKDVDVKNSPQKTMNALFEWLDIDKIKIEPKTVNKTKILDSNLHNKTVKFQQKVKELFRRILKKEDYTKIMELIRKSKLTPAYILTKTIGHDYGKIIFDEELKQFFQMDYAKTLNYCAENELFIV